MKKKGKILLGRLNVQEETIREKLVNAIISHSQDEYEYSSDLINLAKNSDEELIDKLIYLLDWYQNSYQN
jgi:hypothetical protein